MLLTKLFLTLKNTMEVNGKVDGLVTIILQNIFFWVFRTPTGLQQHEGK